MALIQLRSRCLLGVALAFGCAGDSDSDSGDSSTTSGSESSTAPPTSTVSASESGTTTATTSPETTATTEEGSTSSGAADSTSAAESSGSESSTTGAAVCGDGTRDAGELCDDGNAADDDLCRNDCSEIVLNFDTDAAGDPIANATVLDDFYFEALELTFLVAPGGVNCGSGDSIFANDDHYPDDWGTQPNCVSTCEPGSSSDIADEFQGSIELDFATLDPAQACVLVWAEDDTSQGFVRALDDMGAMIDEVQSDAGVTGELCLSAAGMRAIVFGGVGSTYVRLDDLRLIAG